MEVQSFKMVSGEEVVARVVGTKENSSGTILAYKLESPLVLSFQSNGGRMGLAFVPWTLSNPDIAMVEVAPSMIITMFKPADQVEKEYLQQTSKIALA